jgi:hypothetical protein
MLRLLGRTPLPASPLTPSTPEPSAWTRTLPWRGRLFQAGGIFSGNSNHTIKDAGGWFQTFAPGFFAGTSTVIFNGATNQTIDPEGSTFYDVILSGPGNLQLRPATSKKSDSSRSYNNS